jgi:hypothetical protein
MKMTNHKKIRLSKSQYVKGRQCYKKIWLYNHKKELMDDASEFQKQIFKQGTDIGVLAQSYFEHGAVVDAKYNETDLALKQTNHFLADIRIKVIFEATFIYDDVLVKVDVLKKNEDGSFDLIEVKSSTSIKDVNFLDLAVQKYILSKCGLKIRSSSLMFINNQFRKNGTIDVQKFFKLEPLDQEIQEEYEGVSHYIKNIKKYVSMENCPTADIGTVCKSPYQCEFMSTCWGDLKPTSIHYLNRISDTKRKDLIEMGCYDIKDIPNDFNLSDGQKLQVKCEQENYVQIEHENLNKFLKELEYPLYFLDFETLSEAIPRFEGFRPYQHYVFQYSLHIQSEQGSDCNHKEYLASAENTPKDMMIDLLKHIGEKGSVIVYSASFERGKIQDLINLYPEHEPQLSNIISRMWDLRTPFQKKWYVQKEFLGKDSIKNILPALCPELSYDELKIKKGDEALASYLRYIQLDKPSPEFLELQRAMLDYCKLDTWAMVRILGNLINCNL